MGHASRCASTTFKSHQMDRRVGEVMAKLYLINSSSALLPLSENKWRAAPTWAGLAIGLHAWGRSGPTVVPGLDLTELSDIVLKPHKYAKTMGTLLVRLTTLYSRRSLPLG